MTKYSIKQPSVINYISLAVALTALLLVGILFLKQEDKIVYVDAVKLISQYKGLESSRKKLESKRAEWKMRLDTLENEFKIVMEEYKLKKNTVSKKELSRSEELIKSKQQVYLNYQQALRDESKKQDDELAREILNKVNDYLKRYGKGSKYKIILAATQLGSIAYADEALDITDEVLKGLNQEYDRMNAK